MPVKENWSPAVLSALMVMVLVAPGSKVRSVSISDIRESISVLAFPRSMLVPVKDMSPSAVMAPMPVMSPVVVMSQSEESMATVLELPPMATAPLE